MSKKLFVTMLAVSAMLAACSNDEDGRKDGTPVAASFTASINPHTKAYDDTWEVDDKIGVTAYEQSSLVEDYQNIQCSFNGQGGTHVDWLPQEPYFYKGTEDVMFKAYYPHASSVSSSKIPVDASRQGQSGEQKKIDFLFAEGTGNRLSPEVELQFQHKMTKLVFNITRELEDENEDFTKMSALLDGIKLKGSFDISTGLVTASDDDPLQLLLTHTGNGITRKVTLIVVPQSQPVATLAITVGKDVYKADIPFTGDLLEGKSYTYNITVKNATLVIDDSEIRNWELGNGEGEDVGAIISTPDGAKVGDYFYADGTWSSILNSEKKCIGIVFSTTPCQEDRDRGWRNGYVMALKDVEGNFSWTSNFSGYSNKHVEGLTSISNFRTAYSHLNGLDETDIVKGLSGNSFSEDFPAFYQAQNYGQDTEYAAPSKTSGWYLPSIGQWCAILENLGGADLAGRLDTEGTSSSITINQQFLGNLNDYMDQTSGDRFSRYYYYLSSSEFNDSFPWSVFVNASSNIQLSVTSNGKYTTSWIRTVLAF